MKEDAHSALRRQPPCSDSSAFGRTTARGGSGFGPEKHDPRSFGLSVGAACAALALVAAWRGRVTLSWILGGGAVALMVSAVVRPELLRVPSAVWWRFAKLLGWINSRLLLSACFFLILTPVGIVLRLCGRDLLRLKRRGYGSGWLPYPERVRDPKHYERMF